MDLLERMMEPDSTRPKFKPLSTAQHQAHFFGSWLNYGRHEKLLIK